MLDERKPFDVNEIDKEIETALSTSLPRRGVPVSPAPLRRGIDGGSGADSRPFTLNPPPLETPTRQAATPNAEQPRPDLLDQRQQTHGTFEDNANLSQRLKEEFRAVPGWHSLSMIEREAMDMIALKFSRILSGKSMERQHWEDIVGYARLVEQKC